MTSALNGTGVSFSDGTTQSSGYQASKAWVRFNGSGGISIGASYNVSSVVRNGTGNYTVNFSSALADSNYSVAGSCNVNGASASVLNMFGNGYAGVYGPTSSSFTFTTMYNTNSGGLSDSSYVSVIVFR